MNKKAFLRYTLMILLFAALAITAAVFITSLAPGERARTSLVRVDLASLAPGQVKLVTADLPIYVVAQSPEMEKDLKQISEHVWDRRIATEYVGQDGRKFFIFIGVGARNERNDGCMVTHYPKNRTNEYRRGEAVWLGGFWDMCRDLSYDYAGRTIKDTKYTYINFTRDSANLAQPLLLESDDAIVVFGHPATATGRSL